jgi:hypothetical protein
MVIPERETKGVHDWWVSTDLDFPTSGMASGRRTKR